MQEICELKRQGLSLRAISDLTGYDRKTIRRYLCAEIAAPVYGPRHSAESKLDAFKAYLRERMQAGVWNAHHEGIPLGADNRGGKTLIHMQQSAPVVERRSLEAYEGLATGGVQ